MKIFAIHVANQDAERFIETLSKSGIAITVIPATGPDPMDLTEDAERIYREELPELLQRHQTLAEWEFLSEDDQQEFAARFVRDTSPDPALCSVPRLAPMRPQDLQTYLRA